MTAAIARWDAFLAQIRTRHADVLLAAEADAMLYVMAIAGGGDAIPLSHQLMGVHARLQDLESKITDTWHAAVEQAISDEGHGAEVCAHEYGKGLGLRRSLEDRREELDPRIFAELARRRFAHGTAGVRSVAAVGAHALAQEAAVGEWRAMRAAEHRMHDHRPPYPLEAIVAYERSQIAYWRAYLAVRAQLEPELSRDPGMEIRSRMEQWYIYHAEYEEAWVRAGRPRTPIA
jgi:hypothetical protein